MATTTRPSSLMLTYASSSSVFPQDLTASLVSFKPKPLFATFSLCPLVLRPRERKPSKWVSLSLLKEAKSQPFHVVSAALAAETELDEAVEEEALKGADGSVPPVNVPKPKKGKAALLLKRDRVSLLVKFVFFWLFHNWVLLALGFQFQKLLYCDKVCLLILSIVLF